MWRYFPNVYLGNTFKFKLRGAQEDTSAIFVQIGLSG